jgi:outer membrane protein W
MKKYISILAFITITAAGAFAQVSLSAGGGLFLDMSYGNGIKGSAKGSYNGYNISSSWTESMRNISLSGHAFFDAAYVEAGVNFAIGALTDVYKDDNDKKIEKSGTVQQFGFTFLGKYPLDLGTVTLFPLLGINYNIVLGGKYDGYKYGNKLRNFSDLNQFGILAGAGIDYDINTKLYIRCNIMLQIRLASKYSKDSMNLVKENGFQGFDNRDVKTTLGLGPVIRLGLGYRF